MEGLREARALRDALEMEDEESVALPVLPLGEGEVDKGGVLDCVGRGERDMEGESVEEGVGRGLLEARALIVSPIAMLAVVSAEPLRDEDGEAESVPSTVSDKAAVVEGVALQVRWLEREGSSEEVPAPPLLPLAEPLALLGAEELPVALALREGEPLAESLRLPLLLPLELREGVVDSEAPVVGEATLLAVPSQEELGKIEREARREEGEELALDVEEDEVQGEADQRAVPLAKAVGVAPSIILGVATLLTEPEVVPPAPPLGVAEEPSVAVMALDALGSAPDGDALSLPATPVAEGGSETEPLPLTVTRVDGEPPLELLADVLPPPMEALRVAESDAEGVVLPESEGEAEDVGEGVFDRDNALLRVCAGPEAVGEGVVDMHELLLGAAVGEGGALAVTRGVPEAPAPVLVPWGASDAEPPKPDVAVGLLLPEAASRLTEAPIEALADAE